jgi:hypothetical protein
MKIVRWTMILICAGAMLSSAGGAGAQSKSAPAEYVPLPDPGYGLYFHDTVAAPNVATRWGYHDGWTDGRRDRNHGDTHPAQEKSHYLTPPDHGAHPGMMRDQYEKAYRAAYAHGYEHGSRL